MIFINVPTLTQKVVLFTAIFYCLLTGEGGGTHRSSISNSEQLLGGH